MAAPALRGRPAVIGTQTRRTLRGALHDRAA